MLRPVPRDHRDSAEPGAGAADVWHARTLLRPSWLRAGVLGLAVVVIFGGVVVLAYQLALARVPQHRATLERLVRAQTGLHMRFNEVGLRWGWYGPEVVFRRVELGEPERSNVLLRASELMVNFDAWRTLQSGQLQAGRITLIGPDIDLVRLRERADANARTGIVDEQSAWNRSSFLKRWPRGRVDVEGGTLTLPALAGATESVTLKIRRASLRRTDHAWSASANVFLPERLGRTARVWMRLQGDAPAALNGSLQIEGRRLVFSGWRELLRSGYADTRLLPASGSGDAVAGFTMKQGRLDALSGSVRAGDVAFRPSDSQAARGDLFLGYLRGNWSAQRHGDDWRLSVDDLGFGPEADMPRTSLALTVGNNGARFEGTLKAAPLQTLLAVAGWAAPDLDLRDATLAGDARNITFDWLITRPMGQKLRLGAKLRDVTLASSALGIGFSGLNGELSGTETAVIADIEATEGTLDLSRAEGIRLKDVKAATRLQLQRMERGWTLSTEQLSLEHENTQLLVSGALALQPVPAKPEIDIRGTVEGADVSRLHKLLGTQTEEIFGSMAQRLTAGRVETGKFSLQGTPQELPFGRGSRFSGSLLLRQANLAANGQWPQVDNLDAQLTWQGPRMRLTVERGSGGPFELVSLNADWQAQNAQPPHITAQARGKIEEVTAWLADHPELIQYAEHAQMLPARGPALFTLETSAASPRSRSPGQQLSRVQVAASFEDASLDLAHLPPVQAVRGLVSFDRGKLQRSTLTASWLGGPVTLRLSQQERGADAGAFSVRAEGLLDAHQLASAVGIEVPSELSGRTEWTGTLTYMPAAESQPAMFRARANSALVGVESELPEPLTKSASVAMPLRIEMQGSGPGAALRVSFGDRLRSTFALNAAAEGAWQVQRGTLRFGEGPMALPGEPVIELAGTLDRVELPAWVAVWRQIEAGTGLLPLRADVSIRDLVVAGRSYSDVTLGARRDDDGFEVNVNGVGIDGVVRWPGGAAGKSPAEARFTHLTVPERTQAGGVGPAIAAFAPATDLSVDQLEWRGRTLGALGARIESRDGGIAVERLRLADATHEAQAAVVCESTESPCVMSFELNSSDAAATLRDFGFREELNANRASLSGQLEWPVDSTQPWLETVSGKVAMVISDGSTRIAGKGEGRPLALLSVPALLHQSAVASTQSPIASLPPTPAPALSFDRLEADFELRDGNAFTANLHFDGDAEILMRGRVGLATRDYDQVAWVLRGEDRLPAAVRRFGATPRVAAAWLALREFVSGSDEDRTRAMLHLGGTWDTPVVARLPKAPAEKEENRSQ